MGPRQSGLSESEVWATKVRVQLVKSRAIRSVQVWIVSEVNRPYGDSNDTFLTRGLSFTV